jgi:hypothetical protein
MKNLPFIEDTYLDGTALKEQVFTTDDANYFYKTFRPGAPIPKEMVKVVNDAQKICEIFNLKGVQFGNWLTTEDKYNYLAATYICFNDINKVLKFKSNNIGFKNLILSFGARGVSSASAHFESSTEAINITRYWRSDKIVKLLQSFGKPVKKGTIFPKNDRLLTTGGAGALAHEYGHFLDYFFGRYAEPNKTSNWLSGPYRTTAKKIDVPTQPLRLQMYYVINTALFDPKGKPTTYNKNISKESDYINRRLEIFARIFEQYILYKLKVLKIENKFLTKTVYKNNFYMNEAEFKKVLPHLDKLVLMMQKLS